MHSFKLKIKPFEWELIPVFSRGKITNLSWLFIEIRIQYKQK